ncbi:hypothetical protein ACFYW9_20120 [Streptomyces sp. NPDC002698]|uniref:hypothetical protein n=1 Tax=Streptomyces sp. NPDC002698 TaxID=3364660 RepID=UPI0036AF3002
MQTDDILWRANMASAGRPWRRWLINTLGTAGPTTLALLLAATGGGVDGVLFRVALGGTALTFGVWAFLLVRDLRSLVDVRVTGGGQQLRMTTAAGRVLTRAANDVAQVDLVYTPWRDASAVTQGELRLELRLRQGVLGYRGRWCGTRSEERHQTVAMWRRVCPAATIAERVQFRTEGTGD